MSASESYLYSLPRFALVGKDAYKPGLDRMIRILEYMGNPQSAFRSIHVAGTNGKGSTASFIAAIASAAGLKTGLHTSPHLLHVGERMRINGVQAPASWIEEAVQRRKELFKDVGVSFFEATTALAFEYFAEFAVELAVVEVGLGGRFDATNVLRPELSIITGVALDHEELLGATVERIAYEKAGIIKAGVPVLTAASKSSVVDVIRGAAESCHSEFHSIHDEVVTVLESRNRVSFQTPIRTYSNLKIDLAGSHQICNAATAVRAAELCSLIADTEWEAVQTGLAETRSLSGLHGRLEKLHDHPDIFVDVAHNADAILASIRACTSLSGRLDHLFVGLMADKQIEAVGVYLAGCDFRVSTLHIDSERAMDPIELAERLRTFGASVESVSLTVPEALSRFTSEEHAPETLLFLGSHLVVADAMRWVADRTHAGDAWRRR